MSLIGTLLTEVVANSDWLKWKEWMCSVRWIELDWTSSQQTKANIKLTVFCKHRSVQTSRFSFQLRITTDAHFTSLGNLNKLLAYLQLADHLTARVSCHVGFLFSDAWYISNMELQRTVGLHPYPLLPRCSIRGWIMREKWIILTSTMFFGNVNKVLPADIETHASYYVTALLANAQVQFYMTGGVS